jgi:hypothetical protein
MLSGMATTGSDAIEQRPVNIRMVIHPFEPAVFVNIARIFPCALLWMYTHNKSRTSFP